MVFGLESFQEHQSPHWLRILLFENCLGTKRIRRCGDRCSCVCTETGTPFSCTNQLFNRDQGAEGAIQPLNKLYGFQAWTGWWKSGVA